MKHMNGSKSNRIDVFSELVSPHGAFDYEKCRQLLDNHYDSFVNFCDVIRMIPEEISEMTVVDFDSDEEKVLFEVSLHNGEKMVFEK